jgi:hypothetical protein
MIEKVHIPIGFNGLRYYMQSNDFSAGYNQFEITLVVFIPSRVLEIYEENKKNMGQKNCVFSSLTPILLICIHATPREELDLLFSTTFHGDNEVWDDHTVDLIIPCILSQISLSSAANTKEHACLIYLLRLFLVQDAIIQAWIYTCAELSWIFSDFTV